MSDDGHNAGAEVPAYYNVTNLMRQIPDSGVMSEPEVAAVWETLRATLRNAHGYYMPDNITHETMIPLLTYFIIHTASSRQPGTKIIDVPHWKVTVDMVISATGNRLRRFLRYFSGTASQIIAATPKLREKQGNAFGVFGEDAIYAFDFVNLNALSLGSTTRSDIADAVGRRIKAADDAFGLEIDNQVMEALDAPQIRNPPNGGGGSSRRVRREPGA